MCGIIGIITKNDKCIDIILNGLKQLQNRGYDSSGICTLDCENEYNLLKYASTNKINAINLLDNNITKINDSYIGIGHTRWATHGGKTDYNSHPHISYDEKICIVHNGIIENYKELKSELIDKGITFKSDTDSEVIANMLAYESQFGNNFIFCIEKVISKLEGTWGLAILNKSYPDNLYCIRHGSPILVGSDFDKVIISSEQSGFCGLVSNYIVLESNDICIISRKEDNISVNTNLKYEIKKISSINYDLSPEPYQHWTIKEIYEQKESSLRAISLGGRLLDQDKVKLGGLEGHIDILINIDNIIVLGCGTSYNAGLVGIDYLKNLCNFNTVQVIDGAEFNEKDIPKYGKTALILLSQSGETKDLHRCIKIGKDNNLFLIGVINVVDSMIARECNCGCYLNAGREVAVASTKCFTSQCILMSMIAIWFSQIHKSNNLKRMNYIKCLRRLSIDISKSIEISLENIDKYLKILNKDNLFILGKGKSEAIAKEGALKIKEISYIHAEGYSGSALKHGPFALLKENVPVILIAPDNEHFSKMNNVYEEIISRKSPILFITNTNCDKENSIILPYNELYSDILSIIPLQIISYYLSLERGINPDFPRNLAKTVVVE